MPITNNKGFRLPGCYSRGLIRSCGMGVSGNISTVEVDIEEAKQISLGKSHKFCLMVGTHVKINWILHRLGIF